MKTLEYKPERRHRRTWTVVRVYEEFEHCRYSSDGEFVTKREVVFETESKEEA